MNETQAQALNEAIDFLLSYDFQWPLTVKHLIDECDRILYNLFIAKIDESIYNHIKYIMECQTNSLI